ncbi:MAG TPA: hypothetical protein VM032_12345 [Vicinamibacterales bacterium]|nr:hypothetical protein [Vicinamibacterales bacterium]
MAFQAVLAQRLAALADDLTAAAAADVDPLVAQLAELTAARERYRAHAEELTATNDALSLELEARAVEHEAAAAAGLALESARDQSARLAAQLAALESRYADLQRAHDRLEAEIRVCEGRAEMAEAERAAAANRLAEWSTGQDRERAQREALEGELARVRTMAEEARASHDADAARLTRQIAEARSAASVETARLREELAVAGGAQRERLVARLAEVFDHIALAASVDDVLGAAANGLTDDFARVAVFGAHDGRLEARYQRGFDPVSGVGQVAPAVGDGSLLGRAAATRELKVHPAATLTDPPFPGHASTAITAPVMVRGELLALIYADTDGQPGLIDSTGTSARIADLVRRHAALRLDRLTVELKTTGELRAYARMLLDEVEYVYRADTSARKTDADRLERLMENLRCARQIYQQRAAAEGPAMAGLFEDVLTAVMATKATAPFGRELAGVASMAHPEDVSAAPI